MTSTGTFAEVFPNHWMPHAPLASDAKDGSYKRMSREQALTLSHIEANPTALQSLVIVDHDGADAEHIAELVGLPQPSYVAMNPLTNAGHIVYTLAAPVCMTDAGNRRPVNLLARVESGLRTMLDGDAGYTGRITKNPYHQEHLPIWGTQDAVYGLIELAKAVDALGFLPARNDDQARRITGSGRNVDLFHMTRQWGYKAFRQYWGGPVLEWEETVEAMAWDRNLTVIGDNYALGPMDRNEVHHLSRSISRWIWRNHSPEGFSDRQARVGRKATNQAAISRSGTEAAAAKRRIDRSLLIQEATR